MNAQHTPGPWAWDGDYTLRPTQPDPTSSATHTILSEHGPFGFLGTDHRATEAEFQANKRLIAAAPDLLEALQVFAERNSSDEFITITVRTAFVDKARAAIAKATGADA